MGKLKGFLIDHYRNVADTAHGWRNLRNIISDPKERQFLEDRKTFLEAGLVLSTFALLMSIDNPNPEDAKALRAVAVTILTPATLFTPFMLGKCYLIGCEDRIRRERLNKLTGRKNQP